MSSVGSKRTDQSMMISWQWLRDAAGLSSLADLCFVSWYDSMMLLEVSYEMGEPSKDEHLQATKHTVPLLVLHRLPPPWLFVRSSYLVLSKYNCCNKAGLKDAKLERWLYITKMFVWCFTTWFFLSEKKKKTSKHVDRSGLKDTIMLLWCVMSLFVFIIL